MKLTHRVPMIAVVAGMVLLVASFFVFLRLDYVVHHDLYKYGLQYSDEWGVQYWNYRTLTMIFIVSSVFISGLGFLILLKARPIHRKPPPQKKKGRPNDIERYLNIAFLIAGGLAFTAATAYNSTPAALIGLGLIFWGAILLYIRAGKYVKETLLDKTAFPTLAAMDQLLKELGYEGQPVYLPPKFLRDIESSRIIITKERDTVLSIPLGLLSEKGRIVRDEEAISLEPPGVELMKLLEKSLRISFTRTSFQYFAENIPKTLMEDLEVAQNVEIQKQNGEVTIRMENSSFAQICNRTQELTRINNSIGCPLCSALACALTKTVGAPISIQKEQSILDNRTIAVSYRILNLSVRES
ncbi:MAG: hypothetical protein ACFE7R_11170 [Candidatus Hodarchaeota archaeon]